MHFRKSAKSVEEKVPIVTVSMMMRSNVGHNHADDDINEFKNEMK